MERKCPDCGAPKIPETFNRSSRRDGWQTYCKRCHLRRTNEARRRWNTAHPDEYKRRRRHRRLPSLHGLTAEQYEQMLAIQGGVCGMCGCRPEESRYGVLAIDHDNDCCPGPVSCGSCTRGLLCSNCNGGIALLRHDPSLMFKAADWVMRRGAEAAGLTVEAKRA